MDLEIYEAEIAAYLLQETPFYEESLTIYGLPMSRHSEKSSMKNSDGKKKRVTFLSNYVQVSVKNFFNKMCPMKFLKIFFFYLNFIHLKVTMCKYKIFNSNKINHVSPSSYEYQFCCSTIKILTIKIGIIYLYYFVVFHSRYILSRMYFVFFLCACVLVAYRNNI